MDGLLSSGFGFGTDQIGSRPRVVTHVLPKNPLDKCTIVSLFPRAIIEFKPTIFPGRFEIPAAPMNGFSLYTVEGSSYFIQSQIERMPPTEIQINSLQLAKSIVQDYLSAMWLSNPGVRHPGLFWLPGEYNNKTVLNARNVDGKLFADLLEANKEYQRLWFLQIIDEADSFWARSGGNPRAIPDDAKLAAEYLSVKGKPWMANIVAASLNPCKACGEMINTNFPICKFCHAVIDEAKAKELGIVFAKV